jgi:uncharacterized membrane protein YfcA
LSSNIEVGWNKNQKEFFSRWCLETKKRTMIRRFSPRPRWSSSFIWSIVVVFLSLMIVVTVDASSGKKCSTHSKYQCPNCGGFEVKDCFECDGFLSSDPRNKICFNRVLFNRHNTDPTDPGNYYHFLWNDLVAAVVWFFIAGVAVSCGVGGGGIFVPLGVLLLQFSPKQAAGLSQCSIFGSTFGGLLLNAQGKHPNEHITDAPGAVVNATDDVDIDNDMDHGASGGNTDRVTVVAMQEKLSKSAIASYTGTFYTRPVIHYDMVLFLAPMEIAGALMGVIVQTLLPNWLYLICASIVLSFTAYKTYGKFITQRQREKKEEIENQKQEEELALEDVDIAIAELQQRHGDKDDSKEMIDATTTNAASSKKSTSTELVRQETTGATTVLTTSEETGSSTGDASLTGSGGIGGEGLPGSNGEKSKNQHHKSSTWEDTAEMKALRQQYLVEDMRQFPKEKIIGLVVIWIIIFILTLLRGGKGVPSLIGITCENSWYSVLIVLQFAWLMGAAIYFGIQLIRKQQARVQVRYPFQAEDPVWDVKALRFFGSCTFAAGVLAGLIGIGGGMILGPLMLVMGLHPRVSSASTATMIVLTSSSVAVAFVTSGLVPWSYALFYFMVCFLGALINKRQIDAYVKRTGRASLLIFILASIILFATLGCVYNLFSGLAAKDWCLDGFNQFCKVSSKDDNCPIDRALSYGVTFLSN